MKREENERMKTKFSTKAYARVHLHNVIGLDETRLHTFYMKFRHTQKNVDCVKSLRVMGAGIVLQ